MSRAIAIINPSSAKGRARRAWPEISATLHDAGLSFDEVTTHSPQEGMERAALAGGDGYGTVISVGGDGTTHWTVNGLMRSQTDPPQTQATIAEAKPHEFLRCICMPLD